MANTRAQNSTVSDSQLRTRNNKARTETAKKKEQSTEKLDTTHNRKRTPTFISKSNSKRKRVLAADAQWCVCHASKLNLKEFANEQGHYERRRCHSRYKYIITNYMPEAEQSRLLQEFENWCCTVDCTEFWKERKRAYALATASANCSEAIDKILLSDSQSLVESLNQGQTTESLTQNPKQTTTAPQSITTATTSYLNQEHYNIRQENDSEEQMHWFIGNDDITSLFRKYQYQANVIPKPVPLESNIQEILSLSDVLFLANEQHSECKVAIFEEKLLKNLLKDQTQTLLSNVPTDTQISPMMTL